MKFARLPTSSRALALPRSGRLPTIRVPCAVTTPSFDRSLLSSFRSSLHPTDQQTSTQHRRHFPNYHFDLHIHKHSKTTQTQTQDEHIPPSSQHESTMSTSSQRRDVRRPTPRRRTLSTQSQPNSDFVDFLHRLLDILFTPCVSRRSGRVCPESFCFVPAHDGLLSERTEPGPGRRNRSKTALT